MNFLVQKQSSGQALLIVLLTMAVVLTVVLSTVSRSVTEIELTSYGEDAQRAFDAAEAGIERALLIGGDPPDTTLEQATFSVDISNPTPDSRETVYRDILSGESATFWFVSHDSAGDLECGVGYECIEANRVDKICWGEEGTPRDGNAPAIEVSFYYDETPLQAVNDDNFSDVKIFRVTYDPYLARSLNNFFDYVSGDCSSDIAGESFAFSTGTIDLDPPITCSTNTGCLLMAKVRMFYNTTAQPVGLDINPMGGTGLPAQGTLIDSLGVAGDTSRRVNVFQSYPEPPFIFNSAIYSASDIIKP